MPEDRVTIGAWTPPKPETISVPPAIVPYMRGWFEVEGSPEWAGMNAVQRAFVRHDFVRGLNEKRRKLGLHIGELDQIKDLVLTGETTPVDTAYEWTQRYVQPQFPAPEAWKLKSQLKWYERAKRGVQEYHRPQEYIARFGGGAVRGMTYPAEPILRRTTGVDFFGDELRDREQGIPGIAMELAGTVVGFRGSPAIRGVSRGLQIGIRRLLDTRLASRVLPFQRHLAPLINKMTEGTATEAEIGRATAIVRHAWKTKEFLAAAGEKVAFAPIFGAVEGMKPKEVAALAGVNLILGSLLQAPSLIRLGAAAHPAEQGTRQFFELLNQQRIVQLKPGAQIERITDDVRKVLGLHGVGRINLTDVFGRGAVAEYADVGPWIGPRVGEKAWWLRQAGRGYAALRDPTLRDLPQESLRMLQAYTLTGRAPAMPAAAGEGVAGVPSAKGGYDWVPVAWRQAVMRGVDAHGRLGSLAVPLKTGSMTLDQVLKEGAKIVLPPLQGRSEAEIRELIGAIETGKPLALPEEAGRARVRVRKIAGKRQVYTGTDIERLQKALARQVEKIYQAHFKEVEGQADEYGKEAAREAVEQAKGVPFINAEALKSKWPGIYEALTPSERMRVLRGGPGHDMTRGVSGKRLPGDAARILSDEYKKIMRKVYDARTGKRKPKVKWTKAEQERKDQIEILGRAYAIDLDFRAQRPELRGYRVYDPEDFVLSDAAGNPIIGGESAREAIHPDAANFETDEDFIRWWINQKLGGVARMTGGATGTAMRDFESIGRDEVMYGAQYVFPFPQLRDVEDMIRGLETKELVLRDDVRVIQEALDDIAQGKTPKILTGIPLERVTETGVKVEAARRAAADAAKYEEFSRDLEQMAEAEAAAPVAAPGPAPSETRHLPGIAGWHTEGAGAGFAQRSHGVYIALDAPFKPEAGPVSAVVAHVSPDRIYDPGRVLPGTPEPDQQAVLAALNDAAKKTPPAGIADVGRLRADVLKRLGYEAEAGWIDGIEGGNRELVVFSPENLVTPSAAAWRPEGIEPGAAVPEGYPEPTQYELGKPAQRELGLERQPYLADQVANKIAAEAAVWKELGPALQRTFEEHVDSLAQSGDPQGPYLQTVWRAAQPERWYNYDKAIASLTDEHMAQQAAMKELRAPPDTPEGQRQDALIREREDAFNELMGQLDEAAGHTIDQMEAVGGLEPDDLPPIDPNEVRQALDGFDFMHLKNNPEAGGIDIQAILAPIFRLPTRLYRSMMFRLRGDPARADLEIYRLEDDLAAAEVAGQVVSEKVGNVVARMARKYVDKYPKIQREFLAREIPYLIENPKELAARGDADLNELADFFRWAMDRYLFHLREVLPTVPWLPDYVPYMIEWPADTPPGVRKATLSSALSQFRPSHIRGRKSADLYEFARRIERLGQRLGVKVRVLEDIAEITRRYVRNTIPLRAGREFMLNATEMDIPVKMGTGPKAETRDLPLLTSLPDRGMYQYYKQLPNDKLEHFWHLLTGEHDPEAMAQVIADPQTSAQSLKKDIYVLKDYYEPLLRIIPGMTDISAPERVWQGLVTFYRGVIFTLNPSVYLKNLLSDASLWAGAWWDPTGIVGIARSIGRARMGHWALRSPAPEATEALQDALLHGLNLSTMSDVEMGAQREIATRIEKMAWWRRLRPDRVARGSARLVFKGCGGRFWLGAYMAGKKALMDKGLQGENLDAALRELCLELNKTFGRMPRHKLNRIFDKATKLLMVSPMWTPGNFDLLTTAATGRGFGSASQTPEQRARAQWRMIQHIAGGFMRLAFWSWALTGALNWVHNRKWKHQFIDYPPEYWFYIGTGLKDQRGREIMLGPVLYAYFMDYVRAGRSVVSAEQRRRFISNKLITPAGLALEWITNRGTFGEEVVPENAPVLEGIWTRWNKIARESAPAHIQLFLPPPGSSDPLKWRAIAMAFGTNLAHLRPGQADAMERFINAARVRELNEYYGWRTNRDIYDLLNHRDYEVAAQMLAERYRDVGDMIDLLERYYCPHWSMTEGSGMSQREQQQMDAMTSEEGIAASKAVIAEEQALFGKMLSETWIPLLTAAMGERGMPIETIEDRRLRRLMKAKEKMGGIQGTPVYGK